MKRRQVSIPELIESALQAVVSLNPKINAFVRVLPNAAQGAVVNGPFCGVPLLLKDTGVSLAGVPTEYGSRHFKNKRDYDSELVRRYKNAGFLIIGKTNYHRQDELL